MPRAVAPGAFLFAGVLPAHIRADMVLSCQGGQHMRGGSWFVGGFLMLLMAVAVVALITAGSRWLWKTGPNHETSALAPSGPLPQALADEMKRHERAAYLRGITDAVAFWRLTGMVPEAPAVRDALWARRQLSPNPLTAQEAQAIVRHATPELGP
jgi:hypothetical protein